MTKLRIWIARRLLAVALWITPHGQRAFVSRGRGRPMVTQPKVRPLRRGGELHVTIRATDPFPPGSGPAPEVTP
jgi:hypothetical protein